MDNKSPDLNHFKLALASFVGVGRPHNQTTLAHASGVARTLINGLLQGKRAIGRASQERIARACGLSLADFFAVGQRLAGGPGPLAEAERAPQTAAPLPVISLGPAAGDGWTRALPLALSAAPLAIGPRALVVPAGSDDLEPEGLRPGMLCYCDPDQKPRSGDVVYVECLDGRAALKSFAGEGPELGLEAGRLRLRDLGVPHRVRGGQAGKDYGIWPSPTWANWPRSFISVATWYEARSPRAALKKAGIQQKRPLPEPRNSDSS